MNLSSNLNGNYGNFNSLDIENDKIVIQSDRDDHYPNVPSVSERSTHQDHGQITLATIDANISSNNVNDDDVAKSKLKGKTKSTNKTKSKPKSKPESTGGDGDGVANMETKDSRLENNTPDEDVNFDKPNINISKSINIKRTVNDNNTRDGGGATNMDINNVTNMNVTKGGQAGATVGTNTTGIGITTTSTTKSGNGNGNGIDTNTGQYAQIWYSDTNTTENISPKASHITSNNGTPFFKHDKIIAISPMHTHPRSSGYKGPLASFWNALEDMNIPRKVIDGLQTYRNDEEVM